MSMPKDTMQKEMVEAWRTYLDNLHQSLELVERQINEAKEMTDVCTEEWCEATQHYIDDLANALFTIHEPRWSEPEDEKKLKELKRRVYDLYADYREVYRQVS